MNNNYKDFILKYIRETLGFNAYIENLPATPFKEIPLYLKYTNSYYLLRFEGYRLILSFSQEKTQKTALQLKKQSQVIHKNTGMKVVFGMDKQSPLLRKRLIQEKINFIIPGGRLYLPELLIDLKEIIPKPKYFPDFLSPSAQFLLLYHLQIEHLDSLSFKEIAQKLGYSPKTITQTAKELKAKDICRVSGSKEKRFSFEVSRRQLWKMAEPYMHSPVYKVFYANSKETPFFRKAGNSAFSNYSTLSFTEKTTVAIYQPRFDELLKSKYWNFLDEVEGDLQIEVWRYDPCALSLNGYVDILSLYLCYKDENEDRINAELKELIQKKVW
jgi:DNA-binding HxlR family transcriptional regulator